MKVLFINNYGMDKAWKEWSNGEYPGHHLWGITHLQKYGVDVEILLHRKYVILNKIGLRFKLGNYLDQQARILLKRSHYDLVYSGCGDNTFFLALLRYLGIFRKPLVAIVHHPLGKATRRNSIFVKGHDQILCLSSKVKQQIEDNFAGAGRTELLKWGVELPFYEQKESSSAKSKSQFVVSAGKSSRDHDTLAKAFTEINYPLVIYCSAKSAPTISDITSNIKIEFNHPTQNAISCRRLLGEYEKAYAIAIPLKDTNGLAGLTSLLDAMAVGKAVVMTRNKQIDIDIEKEKIGIWVEPGDVKGWRQAINYLLTHPSETQEMGNRGRYLCETKYNIEVFSAHLARILLEVGARKSS